MTEPRPCWIFGYGSLIFRPDMPFLERRRARLRGWSRRFWQWSTDHRGEPWRPGRVVTLAPAPGESCWGVAYRVDEVTADRILADLDVRERGGYVRMEIEIELAVCRTCEAQAEQDRQTGRGGGRMEPAAKPARTLAALDAVELDGSERSAPGLEQASGASPADPAPVERARAVTFQAWPGNRNYAGPAPLHEIAGQVLASTGPSGTNADYVRDLDAALRSLGVEDAHTAGLAARVREGLAELSPASVTPPSLR